MWNDLKKFKERIFIQQPSCIDLKIWFLFTNDIILIIIPNLEKKSFLDDMKKKIILECYRLLAFTNCVYNVAKAVHTIILEEKSWNIIMNFVTKMRSSQFIYLATIFITSYDNKTRIFTHADDVTIWVVAEIAGESN